MTLYHLYATGEMHKFTGHSIFQRFKVANRIFLFFSPRQGEFKKGPILAPNNLKNKSAKTNFRIVDCSLMY